MFLGSHIILIYIKAKSIATSEPHTTVARDFAVSTKPLIIKVSQNNFVTESFKLNLYHPTSFQRANFDKTTHKLFTQLTALGFHS